MAATARSRGARECRKQQSFDDEDQPERGEKIAHRDEADAAAPAISTAVSASAAWARCQFGLGPGFRLDLRLGVRLGFGCRRRSPALPPGSPKYLKKSESGRSTSRVSLARRPVS